MHAERIDGFNPLAVIDAMKRKMKNIDEKDGPVLLDIVTYRFSGHSPSDADSYRTQEEKNDWMSVDPVKVFRQQLLDAGVADSDELNALDEEIISVIEDAVVLAIDPNVSPRMDLQKNNRAIEDSVFERASSGYGMAQSDVLISREENPA